jgi:nitrite reductase (NO-forming)
MEGMDEQPEGRAAGPPGEDPTRPGGTVGASTGDTTAAPPRAGASAAAPPGIEADGRGAVVDRRPDRAIAAGGIAAAGILIVLGVLAALLPAEARRGIWLPVHLGIAGASSVAIAAVLPFFTATLGVARPVRPAVRTVGVTLPLVGILAVATGIAWGPLGLAEAGGITYLAGMAVVTYAALGPLARSTAPRRIALGLAATAALVDVGLGALLGTLYAAGAPWVLEHWGVLRPAHAWLNVLGFVGVTIVTTLVHLWPTVLGTRIVPGRAGAGMGVGWGLGPPIVALGLATGSDFIARTGAVVALSGAVSLAAFGIARWRARGRWTIDPGWHRAATGHLAAGIAWGAAGGTVAAALVLASGASPGAWSSAVLVALGVGWVAQTLVGAWTHLLPTIGPGGPALHAAQRAILGRAPTPRLVAWQAGTTMLAAGAVAGGWPAIAAAAPTLVVAGGVLAGATAIVSVGLLARAVAISR